MYFANSGGLVQGWDISDMLSGGTHYQRVFRFWAGDDTDASIVIDPQGYLYVGGTWTNVPGRDARPRPAVRRTDEARPAQAERPGGVVRPHGGTGHDGGLLGTPAYYHGYIYATGTDGEVAEVNAKTGKVVWDINLPPPRSAGADRQPVGYRRLRRRVARLQHRQPA